MAQKKVNRGKDFELAIANALSPAGLLTRIYDPMGMMQGIANIADFNYFSQPHGMAWIECKSVYGVSLPLSNISKTQRTGLLESSKHAGVLACIIVWFIDHDETYIVPIEEMYEWLEHTGKKSINIKEFQDDSGVWSYLLKGEKQRVMFKYDGASFNEALKDYNEVYAGYAPSNSEVDVWIQKEIAEQKATKLKTAKAKKIAKEYNLGE